MDAYKEIGGTDENFIEWIKQVNARESAFTNRYDEADGTFDSIYEGIGTKILMISAELINNEDFEAVINIDGIKPYIMDKAKGEITRLSITESIFHDYAESTDASRGDITLKAGEHRNIVLCMAEPDKIIHSYYRSESNKNVATATEDINYDNIYLRLSLWGVQQVAKGENFINKILSGLQNGGNINRRPFFVNCIIESYVIQYHIVIKSMYKSAAVAVYGRNFLN